MQPLADKLRPSSLEDFIGQKHLVGEGKLLNKLIESKKIPNVIIYGECGTGKTSMAYILAKACGKMFYKINGTTTNTDEIKKVIQDAYSLNGYSGIILYIDEIHFLSKRQQQIILEFIENGSITLIGSTTENISYSIFSSILSRCITLNFKPIPKEEIIRGLKNIVSTHFMDYEFKEDALEMISDICLGDFRKAINILELCLNTNTGVIVKEDIENLYQSSYVINNKENHYNNLSYLQKAIRGSDPDASCIALALLLKSKDLESICRRLLVIACEDIGMAHPQAISVVKSCVDSALMVGFPECRIPLSQAVIFLSTLPKSNTSYKAINKALEDIERIPVEMPSFIKGNYLYPHDYKNNYVKQKYTPQGFEDRVYYTYGDNKYENLIKEYWSKIK